MRASSALRGLATAAMVMMLLPAVAAAGTRADESAIRQANQRPTATIHQPTSATTYRVGDVISYAGSATDPEDGSIGNLSWQITVHRCSNSLSDPPVIVQTATGPNGTFTIPNDRGRDSFYTLALTATDSGGLQDTRSVQINPRTAQVTLLTEPPGLKLERDGAVVDSPLAVTATIGSILSVGAPTPQGGLVFSGWTGGGNRQHDVVVGETNTTDTARFRFPHPTWSLGLNGETSQARVDHHPELNVTGDWTVEAWFKDEYPGGYNHDNGYILIKGDTGVNPEIPFQLSISYRSVFAGERVGWNHHLIQYDLAANGVSHGACHHLAATMEAASRTLILYLDGREVARGILPNHTTVGNDGPVAIGRNGSAPGWQGKLDDVRIWNVVRSAEQIRDGRLSELGGAPAGLVGNWKFDEGTGTTAGDSAGTGQPAALQGGATWSPEAQVGPAAPDDPPSISGVTATGVSFTAATITWRTDQNATSQVEYGLTTAYGTTTPVDPAMVRDHTVRLTGLEPNTSYQYRVISTDGSGNRARSGNYGFATPRDNQPPTISGVQHQQVTSDSVTVVWTTSEPADSTVRYGPTASYGLERSVPAMTTSHSVQLTSLQPSTTYHFQAVSEDPSGNEARSTDVTFTTAAPPDRQAPQISGV